MKRRGMMLIAAAMACLYMGAAAGEAARIETGGGALNMRKRAEADAVVLERIPNGAQVEVELAQEEWTRIIYQGKSGYVKSEFVRPLLPQSDASLAHAFSMDDSAAAEAASESVIQTGGFAWIETGNGSLNLRRKADGNSAVVTRVPNSARVEVREAREEWSSIAYQGKSGYVKTAYLKLDCEMIGKVIYPDGDYLYIREDQDDSAKSVASVHASQPMTILEMGGEWIRVSCANPYAGVLEGYVSAKDVSGFRETPGEQPAYCAYMTLSSDALRMGEVLDVLIQAENEAECLLYLEKDGELIFDGLPAAYRRFSYRPRERGVYRLEVLVRDAGGNAIRCEGRFSVAAGEAPVQQTADAAPYSQKDGWWLDKKYGRSNLDQSGCAIFALSHALHLLGNQAEETSPQALAETYPMYLTESGTVTENLLAAAGRQFGFSTGKEKIKDQSVIAQRFLEGAVFSFSVAEGHIALAAGMSGDGSMVRVMDSAPSATFARMENAALYYPDGQGGFARAQTLWDIPGARYYVETGEFGGLEYYLDMDYVARRGVRMIRPK